MELVAASAIAVLVIAAAGSILLFGTRSAADGSADAANHKNASLVEEYLRYNLEASYKISVNEAFIGKLNEPIFSFAEDGLFIMDESAYQSKVEGIQEVSMEVRKSGSAYKAYYSIRAGTDPSLTLSGEIVLNNVWGDSEIDPLLLDRQFTLTPENRDDNKNIKIYRREKPVS